MAVSSQSRFRSAAFTLVELLVTIGIVAALATLLFPLGKVISRSGQAAAEINGAKSAVTAWRAYAGENNGTLLPGYLDFMAASKAGVRNSAGQNLSFPVSARYPFRLAPYLDYQLKGSLLVNKQKAITDDYTVSVAPSFGMNITFVGGDYGGGSDMVPSAQSFATYGKFVVQNINEIYSPSQLIVFASARITGAQENFEGYNAVKSPNLQGKRWPDTFEESRPYYDYGAIHPRFSGRAACAMADGHVELIKYADLFDMRRWSNQAAEADDKDWTLKPL